MGNSSSSSSIHNEEKQSLIQSFRAAVEYLDGTQLPTSATPCTAKPLLNAGQYSLSTKLISRSDVARGVSTKSCRAVEDYPVKCAYLPPAVSITASGWTSAAAVVKSADDTQLTRFDGWMDGSWPAERSDRTKPYTSYAGVIAPQLGAVGRTISVTDISDEPEDLSLRTGACHVTRHVTPVHGRTALTIANSSRFHPNELPGTTCRKFTDAFIHLEKFPTRKPS